MPRSRRRAAIGCLSVVVLLIAGSFTPFGKAVVDLLPMAVSLVLPKAPRQYDATSAGNLRSIYTALTLYESSEGAFPSGSWMDAIQNHLRTSDMSTEEAAKKLVRPDLAGKPGAYGYSLNDAVAGKYHGDIKDPKTILVFESAETTKNAQGDPSKAKGRMAVTVDGSIVTVE